MIPINFSVTEAFTILKPLTLFIVGMVIYAIFIFKFYKFIARKDIFNLNLNQYNRTEFAFLKKLMTVFFYFIEYLFLFPVFVFFWFTVLAILFTFISKNQPMENILLVSIAVVGAIRVTAYYNEELSKDLAKMLPFALLGVYLVDVSYFDFSASFEVIKQIPSYWYTLTYYLLFIVCFELILRIGHGIISMFYGKEEQDVWEEEQLENP